MRARRSSRTLGVVAAATLAMVIAGCGGDAEPNASETEAPWMGDGADELTADNLYEAAKKEGGEIRLWSSLSENISKEIQTAFAEKYPGMKIVPESLAGTALMQRFQTEQEAGVASVDVLMLSTTLADAQAFCDKGYLVDISYLPEAENWSENAPEAFDGCVVLVGLVPHGIRWNTNHVKPEDAPKSFEDLLDERYAGGKIGSVDPGYTGVYTWMWNVQREKSGEDALKAFRAQDPVWGESGTTLLQRLGAGEFHVTYGGGYSEFELLKSEGVPIDGFTPNPYVASERTAAVVTKAKHPASARLLVNWLMSPEGQKIASPFTLLPGVEGVEEAPPGWTPTDPAVANPNSPEGLELRDLLGRP